MSPPFVDTKQDSRSKFRLQCKILEDHIQLLSEITAAHSALKGLATCMCFQADVPGMHWVRIGKCGCMGDPGAVKGAHAVSQAAEASIRKYMYASIGAAYAHICAAALQPHMRSLHQGRALAGLIGK